MHRYTYVEPREDDLGGIFGQSHYQPITAFAQLTIDHNMGLINVEFVNECSKEHYAPKYEKVLFFLL